MTHVTASAHLDLLGEFMINRVHVHYAALIMMFSAVHVRYAALI